MKRTLAIIWTGALLAACGGPEAPQPGDAAAAAASDAAGQVSPAPASSPAATVPQADAEAITDRIGAYGTVELDALLRVTGVQPGMNGGVLVVDIVEYELRESRGGTVVGRVRVGG